METKDIVKVLDWAYEKALDHIPVMGNAEDLAKEYLSGNGTLEEKVDSLIRWQTAKCATSGFISGLGGVMTLPVAVSVNISSVLYIHMRMIAAIAYMGGYDLRDDRVKSLVYLCLCGHASKKFLSKIGISFGGKIAKESIKLISVEVMKHIHTRVGAVLAAKFGTMGVVNLTKMVPLIGGVIGGTVDAVATNVVGEVAKQTFIADATFSSKNAK